MIQALMHISREVPNDISLVFHLYYKDTLNAFVSNYNKISSWSPLERLEKFLEKIKL